MGDDNVITIGEAVSDQLTGNGYKKRFSEDTAFKAYDRYLAQEMRLADRLRAIALFKTPSDVIKDTQTKALPGDIPELQMLFEMKKLYLLAAQIEDPFQMVTAQTKVLERMTVMIIKLSARQKEAMEFIESVMARKAKDPDASLTPDQIRAIAMET